MRLLNVKYCFSVTYIMLIYTFCLISVTANSQSIELDSLLRNDRFIKNPLISLLPSVSYSKNTGFNVGFSLSNISRFFQQKRRNEIELAKYINSFEERQIREFEKTQESILKFEVDFENLQADFKALKIEAQIFELDEAQYLAKEITTQEFLPKKLYWIRRYNSIVARSKALYLKGLKISKQTPLPQLDELQNLIDLLKGKNFGSLRAGPQAQAIKKTAISGGLALSYRVSLPALPVSSNV